MHARDAREAPEHVPLQTPRLRLVPWSPALLVTLIEQPDRFEALAGVPAAPGLREFFVSGDVSPEWLARLTTASGTDPWRHGFFVVERERRAVIGTAGFKGAPDAEGMVEIAYGIVSSFEGRGYATEAAMALVRFAQQTPGVTLIRAHTLPEANASTRVLTKCGFRHTDNVIDPDDGPVWRWEMRTSG
ncbi:MAG TPA: GNAT family N-acetyltransferase [Gemmatimonadaceae bacterium]|nr:GNAT family N-acetyltransferase [Gemmatimonadaceae bacterium]